MSRKKDKKPHPKHTVTSGGAERRHPIRRRAEEGAVSAPTGHRAYPSRRRVTTPAQKNGGKGVFARRRRGLKGGHPIVLSLARP